ncbi:MAG: hypothetical protein AB7S81_08740 [Bdellovibrionales bacterium]
MKKVHLYSLALGASVALMTSVPAWASDGEQQGLPQMQVDLFPGLLFWAAVTFALFFIMMKGFGIPAVEATKARRKGIIDADLSVARTASDQAADIREANEEALSKARHKAQKTVHDIIQAANSEATEQRGKQQHEFSERFKVAEDKLDKLRQEALKETPKFIDDLVGEIMNKVLKAG